MASRLKMELDYSIDSKVQFPFDVDKLFTLRRTGSYEICFTSAIQD